MEIAERTGISQGNISRFFSLKQIPRLDTFLSIAKSLEVNLFIEDRFSKTDLNILFERAMTKLGRRPDQLPQN